MTLLYFFLARYIYSRNNSGLICSSQSYCSLITFHNYPKWRAEQSIITQIAQSVSSWLLTLSRRICFWWSAWGISDSLNRASSVLRWTQFDHYCTSNREQALPSLPSATHPKTERNKNAIYSDKGKKIKILFQCSITDKHNCVHTGSFISNLLTLVRLCVLFCLVCFNKTYCLFPDWFVLASCASEPGEKIYQKYEVFSSSFLS